MQVVILAAGDGGRLRPHTEDRPKALLLAAGEAVIDRIIDAFIECGQRDFVVVIGHRGDQIRAHLARRTDARFRCVENPEYHEGNARSLTYALPLVQTATFLMAMGDHLISPGMVEAALAAPEDASYVMADSRPAPEAEHDATRVQVDEYGVVLDIGKSLRQWNAIDTGLFRLRPGDIGHLAEMPAEAELNQAWRRLIDGKRLRAIDVAGAWWVDIDTEADLARAEAGLKERMNGVRRPGLARS